MSLLRIEDVAERHRAIPGLPQALEVVVLPFLGSEDVHDDVAAWLDRITHR